MTATIDVVAEAGAMIGGAVAVPVVTIVAVAVVVAVAQEMEAEAGAMMIVVHRDERLSLLRVLR
ncbi:hypothetical protein N8643_01215 [bacterium]|nr:hypothetical protein [bacterium]MDB4463333.1 hypothetical protein [Akkermansiaceae bacterium]MDB4490751.1 hypothetical protein [bacterium]MDC0289949.1 hypothetical protein [bacterium]MDC0301091.1 hypothetical protein [Akkermansiaceae bacterium]